MYYYYYYFTLCGGDKLLQPVLYTRGRGDTTLSHFQKPSRDFSLTTNFDLLVRELIDDRPDRAAPDLGDAHRFRRVSDIALVHTLYAHHDDHDIGLYTSQKKGDYAIHRQVPTERRFQMPTIITTLNYYNYCSSCVASGFSILHHEQYSVCCDMKSISRYIFFIHLARRTVVRLFTYLKVEYN